MKKIILDARKINDYGIGEYIKNLYPALINAEDFDTRVVINHCPVTSRFCEEIPSSDIIRVKSLSHSVREHLEVPGAVRGLEGFRYFSPHYIFPWFLKNRKIITIHDLIHFKFPHYFRPGIKVKLAEQFIKKIRHSGAKVFTVSENSREDLEEIFGFSREDVTVIHNGIPELFFKYKRGANPKPFPYIMFTGNFKPHKNIDTLLKAFALLEEKHPGLRLVLAGVEKNSRLSGLTKELGIGSRVFPTGFIGVESLIDLLDYSEFFVFPSRYEGFGFPPLEAMARKRAVISTRCGSLGEVLGDAAIFFDPDSPEELSVKMDTLLTDTGFRKRYEEKGARQAEKYTVEKMVSRYLEEIRSL